MGEIYRYNLLHTDKIRRFLMNKIDMQNVSKAGNVPLELKEIDKIQKQPDNFLTMWSNTCTGLYTVICC